MNIFALDTDPEACAQAHCDKHVVKMILEHTQMVCSVAHKYNLSDVPYKSAHRNHPCTLWVGESRENVIWLMALTIHLNDEKQVRFPGVDHKSLAVMLNVAPRLLHYLPDVPMTPFAQAMPEDCRQSDAVLAYRQYYRIHKRHLHTWSKRNSPSWL